MLMAPASKHPTSAAQQADAAVGLPAAAGRRVVSPFGKRGMSVTRLDRFLTATDLDDVVRVRNEISSLTPEESARVVSIVREWNDRQAVANLLFHPGLMPAVVRFDALDRALHSIDTPYFTLAATVGLQGVAPDEVPGAKRAAWGQVLLALLQSRSAVLAGRASVTLCAWTRGVANPDILPQMVALYPVSDEGACRNIVCAVLDNCGDRSTEEFDQCLLEWGVSDSTRAALRRAHAEYADRKERGELRAMIMKAPTLAYIPNLSEGVIDAVRSAHGDAVNTPVRRAWWRFW